MDVKRKTCYIRILDISSTSTDTLDPSFYQCIETCSTEVFGLLSQPLPHLRFNLFVNSETFAAKVVIFRPICEPLYATNTSHHKQETFLYEYSLHWDFLPTNLTADRCSSVIHSSSTVAILILKPASEHEHARLLPRVLWSWTVLLHADTYRKLITYLQLFYFHFNVLTDSPSCVCIYIYIAWKSMFFMA
jgi:hypothetical protein